MTDMAVEAGAAGIGITDIDAKAAAAALALARAAGHKAASASADIRTAEAAHAGFNAMQTRLVGLHGGQLRSDLST